MEVESGVDLWDIDVLEPGVVADDLGVVAELEHGLKNDLEQGVIGML